MFKTYTFNGYTLLMVLASLFLLPTNSYSQGGETCAAANNITAACSTGDLSSAIDNGLDLNFVNCGSAILLDVMVNCASGFAAALTTARTDNKDIWYAVTPSGADEFTVTISNLTGSKIMVLPYLTNGTCPTDNSTMEADITGSNNLIGGACPYFTTDGSMTFQGADISTATTVYLRVVSYVNTNDCADITPSTFDICVAVPQLNDVCTDAFSINSFDQDATTIDSYLPVIQSGDLSLASTDVESSPNSNGASCGATTMATAEQDLWYTLKTPDTGAYYLDINVDFTGVADEMYVVVEEFCSSGTVVACGTISADGTLSFNETNITNAGNALDPNSTYNVKVVRPTGSTATTFDISAQLVAKNNTCAVLQTANPGYNPSSATTMNFNLATDSGAAPAIAGSDLWFHFDPVSGLSPDGTGFTTWSTSAKITLGGLDLGEQVTLLVYKGHVNPLDNCINLAGDHLETLASMPGDSDPLTSEIVNISCLDELHTDALGGYLIRVVQTAGATVADNASITIEPDNPGPYNNDCANIWDGSAPINFGVETADTYNNPYFVPMYDGANPIFFRSGQTQNASDCNPNFSNSDCGGTSNFPATGLESDDRDVWMIFQAGDDPSVGAMDMTVRYNTTSGSDGVLYLYSACNDGTYLGCSGELDGQACAVLSPCPDSEWVIPALPAGEFYLLRIKPHTDNYTEDPTLNAFEYSFDITLFGKPACLSDAGVFPRN